jgi:hypothetical protein
VLLLAGTAKLIPYLLLLTAPSMSAIFALNAVQEVAYQMYRLSDQVSGDDDIRIFCRLYGGCMEAVWWC